MISRLRLLSLFLFFICFEHGLYGSSGIAFEQRADHLIHARLDDENHLLHAHITTRYLNNSPDTLKELFMHLWPNAYSSRNTAFAKQLLLHGNTKFHYAREHELGFIDSLSFEVNGKKAAWEPDPSHCDIGRIVLNEPLLPGEEITISTPFRLKFPDARFSRLGHDGQAYYVTQWYPKPAVYDQHGWHPMPYLNMGEFYSSFGNVEVFLTLPENYVVASSGVVMSPEENAWLDQLSVQTYLLGGSANMPARMDFPPSSQTLKTIHLRQENVHDFAWFADKRFYVLRGQMALVNSDKNVLVGAYFHTRADQWISAVAYAAEAIDFMSEEVFEYPWEVMSVVQGISSAGAGMEYPAVTIIGEALSPLELERVIVHETIHNWFYGIVATNERTHPWLDEGLTTFFENRYMGRKHPDHKLVGSFAGTAVADFFDLSYIDHQDYQQLWYLFKARRNLDQPISLPAEDFSMLNYFGMVYFKAALALKHLEAYLGSETFNQAIKNYVAEWAFRHPGPDNLRQAFEELSEKDLAWFFDELIGTSKKIDYAIDALLPEDEHFFRVIVSNRGEIASPFSLSGVKKGDEVYTQWYEGFEGQNGIIFPKGNYDLLQIDHKRVMPEIRRSNNNFWIGKAFPRVNPMELQLMASIENPEKTRIYYMPLLAWNKYDGVMGGMAFYNFVFPSRPSELYFLPMYGTANDRLAGTFRAAQHFFPERGQVQNYRLWLEGQRYGYTPGKQGWSFNRLEAGLSAAFRKPHAASPLDRLLFVRSTLISKKIRVVENGQTVGQPYSYWLNEVGMVYEQNQVINPWSMGANIEQGPSFVKLSGQARLFWHYDKLHRGIEMRLFGGAFLLSPPPSSQPEFRFRLSGHAGPHDYAFRNTYPGRSERPGTFWGNQMLEADGGFKFPTSVGQTWDWLVAVNIKAEFPVLPLKAYFDAGTYAGASNAFLGSKPISWVLGLQLVPVKDVLEINFPLAVSADIEQVAGFAFDNYWQRVTFSLYIDRLNPFRFLRDLKFRPRKDW